MKRRIITSLNCLLAVVLFMGVVSVASAQVNLTFTSGQTNYTSGANNILTFSATFNSPNGNWVDRLSITFPAGITIVSATPSQAGGCATNTSILEICAPTVSYKTALATPCGIAAYPASFCGWWITGAAAQAKTVTVSVPANFSGPLVINAQATGDFGAVGNGSVTLTQLIPCAIVCPANQIYNLDPGACTQVVNYDVTTTGVCQIVAQACGFIGPFSPNNVNFWQVGGTSGTSAPPPSRQRRRRRPS